MMHPRPKHPHDIPDLREHLLRQWRVGGPFETASEREHRTREAIAQKIMNEGLTAPVWGLGGLMNRTNAGFERSALRHGSLWWVSEEMMDIVEAAARDPKFPDHHVLEPRDAVHPSGLAVFARPFAGLDAQTGTMTITVDAILWGPVNLPQDDGRSLPALGISSYRCLKAGERLDSDMFSLAVSAGAIDPGNNPDEPVDLLIDSDKAKESGAVIENGDQKGPFPDLDVTGWPIVGGERPQGNSVIHIPKGSNVLPDALSGWALRSDHWLPLGRSDWPWGYTVDEAVWPLPTPMPEEIAESAKEDRRLLMSLWAVAQQPALTDSHDEDVPRPVRRRAERAGLESKVRVLYLRRPHSEHPNHDGDSQPGNWSHRWMVSAHWRSQPWGPGRKFRRDVLIPAHIKGPEDLPLKVKPTVHALVR